MYGDRAKRDPQTAGRKVRVSVLSSTHDRPELLKKTQDAVVAHVGQLDLHCDRESWYDKHSPTRTLAEERVGVVGELIAAKTTDCYLERPRAAARFSRFEFAPPAPIGTTILRSPDEHDRLYNDRIEELLGHPLPWGADRMGVA